MQLGGGCASGTLYSAGGGSVRMLFTLVAFIAGSVVGTAHAGWWGRLPEFAPLSIVALWGPLVALAVTLSVLGHVSLASVLL